MLAEQFEVHYFEQPPEFYQGKLPFVATDLIAELKRRHAENEKGIFRINGADSKTTQLCEELDHGPVSDLSKYDNIHIIATALKRYFRSVTENDPLVPSRILEEMSLAVAKESLTDLVPILKATFQRLDQGRFLLLKYLAHFLAFIATKRNENLMTPGNLAVCFAPNLFTSNTASKEMQMKISANSVSYTETMIANATEIFGPQVEDRSLICTSEDIAAFSESYTNWNHVACLISRAKTRSKYGTIPFVPFFNIQGGVAGPRPKRQPPEPYDEVLQPLPEVPPPAIEAAAADLSQKEPETPVQQPPAPAEVHHEVFLFNKAEVSIPSSPGIVRHGQKAGRRPPTRK